MDFRRLPNLAALRAFEAASRHENFSRAADEIHLTHGAISHQVRALEEELGVELFVRNGKRIRITPDGERFASAIRRSLQDLADAADLLRDRNKQKRLGSRRCLHLRAGCRRVWGVSSNTTPTWKSVCNRVHRWSISPASRWILRYVLASDIIRAGQRITDGR
jgi:DNA-binding transcriptional ArsR family regulator